MRSSTTIPSVLFYICAVGGNSTAMSSAASSLSSRPLIDTRDHHRALDDNVFTATTRVRIGQPVDDSYVRDGANRDTDTDTVMVELEGKRSSAGDDAGEEGREEEVGTPKQEVMMMPAWEAKGIISSIMGYSYEQTRSSEEDPPPPSQPSSYLDNRNESESMSTTTTNTKNPAMLIVGILVGMLAMIAVIIVLGLQHIRRRRRRRQQHPEPNLVLDDGYEDELSPAQYSSDSITLLDSVTILSPNDNPTRSSDGSFSDNKIYKYNDNPNEC